VNLFFLYSAEQKKLSITKSNGPIKKQFLMNRFFLSITAFLLFSATVSLAGNEKTIANLKDAFKGESTASAKYAAYALQAKKENLLLIAVMFEATSKAEAVHAANHKSVLEKLGQKVEPVNPEFTVKTTKENIEDALRGETYEITTMYPGFIATSKSEGVNSASKSFGWAMDTEKKHQMIYNNALEALKTSKAPSLPKIYWVCPKCGNTFDVQKPDPSCSFCGTSSTKYFKFGK
jgi:rubrerythrin